MPENGCTEQGGGGMGRLLRRHSQEEHLGLRGKECVAQKHFSVILQIHFCSASIQIIHFVFLILKMLSKPKAKSMMGKALTG